jgi:hypothetical protein
MAQREIKTAMDGLLAGTGRRTGFELMYETDSANNIRKLAGSNPVIHGVSILRSWLPGRNVSATVWHRRRGKCLYVIPMDAKLIIVLFVSATLSRAGATP